MPDARSESRLGLINAQLDMYHGKRSIVRCKIHSDTVVLYTVSGSPDASER